MEGPSYLSRLCVGGEQEGHLVDGLVRKAQFTHSAHDFKSPKAVISKIQDRMSSINNYKQLKWLFHEESWIPTPHRFLAGQHSNFLAAPRIRNTFAMGSSH
jgi:hypothetical protein